MAARAALTGRDAYGAIVTTPSGPKVLTASAASPVVAQQLDALAQRLRGGDAAPPAPWGEIGQLLPPGAAVTLLRSAAFFDGAGSVRPLIVLAAWVAGAFVLLAVGGLRGRAEDETVRDREPALA